MKYEIFIKWNLSIYFYIISLIRGKSGKSLSDKSEHITANSIILIFVDNFMFSSRSTKSISLIWARLSNRIKRFLSKIILT